MPASNPTTNSGRNALATQCAILASITAVGAGLRAWSLNAGDLWFDETFSAHLASIPIRETLYRSWVDVHPPLYFLSLKLWALVLGTSAWSLRGFSLVAGAACIPAAAWAVRRIGGPWIAICAAVSIALSPTLIHYSHEARMYSLLNLVSIVQIGLLWRILENDGTRARWALWVFVSLVCQLVHHLFLLVMAAEGLWLAGRVLLGLAGRWREAEPGGAPQWRRALAAMTVLAVIGALSALQIRMQSRMHAADLSWIAAPSWSDLPTILVQPVVWGSRVGLSIGAMATSLLLLGAAAVGLARQSPPSWRAGLLGVLVYVVFVLLTYWISHNVVRVFFLPRHIVVVLPFLAIACTLGLAALRPRALSAAGLILLWGINFYAIERNCRHQQRPDMSEMLARTAPIVAGGRPAVYDFASDHVFYAYYFRDVPLHALDDVVQGKAAPRGEVLYLHNTKVWPENPNPDMVNPALVAASSARITKIAEVGDYAAYWVHGFSAPKFVEAWKGRMFIGRTEAAGRPWLAFLGAEDASLNQGGVFFPFQFNAQLNARFRWTKSERVVYRFVPPSPVPPGPMSIRLCLTAGPTLGAGPREMHFRIRVNGAEATAGTIEVEGVRKEYRFPFDASSALESIEFETDYGLQPAPALQLARREVPQVGYLLFWAGVLSEENAPADINENRGDM